MDGHLFRSSKLGNYALRSVGSISCGNRESAAQTDRFLASLLSDSGDDVSSSRAKMETDTPSQVYSTRYDDQILVPLLGEVSIKTIDFRTE